MATPGHHGGRPGGTVTEWNIVPLDPPEVAAFWKAIGERPDDQLPRLVFADWLDEREGTVRCDKCKGKKWVTHPESGMGTHCHDCNRTGYVSNGYADLAAALRATAAYFPHDVGDGRSERWWYDRRNYDDDIPADHVTDHLPGDVFDALTALTVECEHINSDMCISYKHYPTPEAAIRDLCAARVKVHRKVEVTA